MSENLNGILNEKDVLVGTLSMGVEYYKGEAGQSGVYIGQEEPTDEGIYVWIVPQGELDDFVMTEEEVVSYIDTSLGEVENGTY